MYQSLCFLGRRLQHSLIIFLTALLFSANLNAQQQCELVFQSEKASNFQILGDLRVNEKKPIVKQCASSCYFEATVSVIESRLSRYLNSEVQIVRPFLFAQLMVYRLDQLSQPQNFSRSLMKSTGGVLDITSWGNTYVMSELLNEFPIPLTEKKSQVAVYRENQMIHLMYRQVGSLLNSKLVESKERGDGQFHGPEADERARGALAEALPSLKQSLERAYQSAPELFSRIQDKSLGLRRDITVLDFEIDGRHQLFLKPHIESYILSRLKNAGELFLGYFHVRRMVQKQRGREGFLDLPPGDEPLMSKAQLMRLKFGADHAVAVVDVLLNKQGRITHLVARNSWSSGGKSDRGYIYISVDYLDLYGGSIHDWTPFERYQRN